MKKKLAAFLLALIMIAQVLAPGTSWAIRDSQDTSQPSNKLVEVGVTSAENYPKLTNRVILDIQREATQKARENIEKKDGVTTFNTPYLPDQDIPDKDKPRIVGTVSADFKTKGLDGGTFDWKGVFGTDSNGNPGKAKLVFKQWLKNKETGVSYELEVSQDGTYSWKDWEGNPARIPLYSKSLEAFTYSVYLDQDVSEKVKLLTYRIAGTPSGGGFEKDPETGLHVANIVIDLSIQQVASTKFVSEWHTNLEEKSRPPVNGEFDNKMDKYPGYFPFSKKDGGSIIIRNDFVNNNDYVDPGYSEYESSFLVKTPEVKVTEGIEYADENDEEGTPTYNLDEASKTITTLDKKHKFKYDFTYDVINGGKLTMTEIIPVTFDANGGKFANFTAPDTETKIVKEVDYDGTLTDKAENPTKDLETFKGWAETKDGSPLSEEKFKEATKNITESKTFYAIWGNNDITAEELVVHESFKNGADWINEFTPTMDELAKQIRIKGEDGKYTPLNIDDHGFAVLDDSEQEIKSIDLANRLYDKLKEDDNTEVSRYTNIKVRVDFKKTGKNVVVDVPIKVIKNIYEAKTKEGRPIYVPKDYVKVTLDPTTKATDPQKTYYYVNKEAKVVIPGNDPTGRDNYLFVGWKTPKTPDNEVFKLDERHKFAGETEIKAKYTKDVIPQEGDKKPDTVPDRFVKVIFDPTDKGDMEGAKIFWVNPEKEVIIPVTDPVGKQYQTFDKWKMGKKADGDVYNPSVKKKFENKTTITATYKEADNIIPFDPTNTDDPKIVRPEGYIKVTFEADPGLKLKEQKAYYVKKNAKDEHDQPLTLAALTKPKYDVEDGYKFKEWDKEDTTPIGTEDIVVKAKAQPLDDVIPKTKDDESEKPKGYITVTFKTTDKGGNIEKVLYINPNKAVALEAYAPAVIPKTGYDSAGWDRPIKEKIQYEDGDVITAKFNEKGAVIPKTNPDGSENKQPEGYKIVTFVIEPDEGGKIAADEVTVYYVNPDKDVVVPQPKTQADTGYEFEKWDTDTVTKAKKYTEDTTVKGNFKKLDDIIPSTDDQGKPNKKPEGYVTLTFDKGDHGKLDGKTAYYVNPKAGKTLGEITKPTVTPEVGWKQSDTEPWDKSDEIVINDNITVIAQYKELPAVVPEKDDEGNENEIPEGYIKVTFSTETNGKITDTTDKTEKIVYVNPNKAVVLKDQAPEVTPNTGYDFAAWDTSIERAIQYNDNDKIIALYNKKGDVIPQVNDDGITNKKPDGYFTVTFLKGDHGELSGKTVYYVKPNTKVTVPAPTVTPNTGWKQKDGDDAWNEELTQTFTKDTDITAQYDSIKDIIPRDEGGKENSKPDGYVTVTFKKGEHGKLEGKTVYYVNPEAGKKLDDITKPKVSPETGYKADGWDKEDTLEIKDNITVTAKYLPLDDVIPKTKEDESEKPDSYIKVTFKTTDKGGNIEKVVYINPNKAVALDKYAPEVTPIDGYEFAGWDKPITEKVQYNDNDVITAQFNEIGLISKVEKPGYVKVVFKEGEHGSLEGDINVWIKPDVDVTIPSPNVIAAEGYKFDGWDKNLKVKLSLDDSPYEITAQYKDIKEGGDTPINPNFKIKDIVTLPFDVNKGDSVDGRDWYKQVVPGDDYEIKRVDVNNPSEADTSKGNAFTSVKATITIRNKNTQEETTVESLIWIYVKEPCNNTCPNPGDNPGGGGSITPTPDPTEPGDDDPDIGGDDKEKDPDNKEETPDEDKDKDPDNKEETPDKDKDKTPEKPGDKDSKKPGQNQPPVKNDSKKKQGQTGTKIVKTINQTGTKVINQVKNFLNPTTGIISNYGLYIGLMAASSVGLFFTRDKKNEDEE